jgi:hypothetical protein
MNQKMGKIQFTSKFINVTLINNLKMKKLVKKLHIVFRKINVLWENNKFLIVENKVLSQNKVKTGNFGAVRKIQIVWSGILEFYVYSVTMKMVILEIKAFVTNALKLSML